MGRPRSASLAALLLGLHISDAFASDVYVQYPEPETPAADHRWTEARYNHFEDSPEFADASVAPGSPSWVVSHGDFGHQTIYQDDNDHDHHIIIQDGEKYDCTIGLSSWKTAWSKEKRAWCCMSHPEFCGSMHLPFNCNEGLSNWKVSWPAAKQQWCCRNFAMGCSSEQKYDCDAGFWNWQVGWTAEKKAFCCKEKNRGCEAEVHVEHHLCAGHEEEWSQCPDQPRCIECTPVDCLFSQWTKWIEGADCIGLRFRHRSIQVENNECGLPCFGTKMESEPLPHLRSKCLLLKQDCVFSSWSQWSVCENQVDQAVRSRHIDKDSLNGGEACKGRIKETRPCGGPEARPCIFSEWHQWTSCSTTCGEGYQSRMRRVASEDYLSGQTCDDALLDTRSCNDQACPTRDSQISHWSTWSPCSGNSLQRTRRREVLVSPEGVGMGFNVSLVEAGRCSPPEGEDCMISEWSSWTQCDKSCHGGQSYRHRRLVHYNINGGQCPIASLQEVTACNTQPCNGETRKCEWQAWQEWGQCSNERGAGLAQRKRDFVAATGDGEACEGSTSELKACIVQKEEVRDCVWGEWQPFTDCTATCGGGTKQRSRAVMQAPNAGGKACDPLDKEVVMPCNTQLCGDCHDGEWGEWSAWGACSAECGHAVAMRQRSVLKLPNACGQLPEGAKQDFKMCDLPLCAEDRDCRLSVWSAWSPCSSPCHGIRQRVRRVVALAAGAGKPCNEESLTEVSDCNPVAGEVTPALCGPNLEAKDCELAGWSEWSQCSSTCGDGQQLRTRTVLQASQNGGKLCTGNLTLVRGCKAAPCPVEVKDCVWGAWSSWGTCVQCSGQRTRHRVIEQLPTIGGKPCEPKQALEMSHCESDFAETRLCIWADWSSEECSQTCTSRTATRHRGLQLVKKSGLMSLSGKSEAEAVLFTGNTSSGCVGSQQDVANCPIPKECQDVCEPVECKFGSWAEWGEPSCSGLCERSRMISEMNNKCGAPCSGPLHQTKKCQSPCNPPIDCELTEWTEWSQCSNATGYVGGQRYRDRSVKTPPQNGGLACYGDLGQAKACLVSIGDLPKPCHFTSWQSWSFCSTTCGEGFQTRHRAIGQLAESGGAQCNGMISEVAQCHAGYWEECGLGSEQDCSLEAWQEWSACSITMQRERVRHFKQHAKLGGLPCHSPMHEIQTCQDSQAAVDCVVSEWTAWDECDQTCGAAQARRQRQVTTFPNQFGKPCPTDLAQMKACEVPNCDVKDCQVSGWLTWSDCSTSCGQGHQSRLRSVLNLREAGGYGCFFSIAENQVCHNPVCSQDCAWDEWEAWSGCSQTCGGGLKTRIRQIKTMPVDGGKHCDEKDMQEVRACNVGTCHSSCVNGLWASWEEWSPCSASCGGGVSSRTREVKRMANSCGIPAAGKDKETRFCNVERHCEADADCLYTGWSSWSTCSASCDGNMVRRRSIATYGHGNGLFCQGALQEVSKCSLGEAEPTACGEGPSVDCELSTWSEWSSCSASCDGGEMRRSRHITQHPIRGETCQGRLEEVKECARDHCGGGNPVDCVYGEWKEWAACLKCSGERKRLRHILVYPAEGGRECAPADLEEIGSCPNPCTEEKYCTWDTWSSWGACSMTCGPGGKRKRTRGMTEAVKPANLDNLALPQKTDAEKTDSEHRKALVEKYRKLYQRTKSLEDGQIKEIVLAFTAGFLALFAVGGFSLRRVRRDPSEDLRDPEAQVSDSERPFLP